MEIFGYEWEEIKKKQQTANYNMKFNPTLTQEDVILKHAISLLDKHGIDGLKELGYDGSLDILKRAGVIQ